MAGWNETMEAAAREYNSTLRSLDLKRDRLREGECQQGYAKDMFEIDARANLMLVERFLTMPGADAHALYMLERMHETIYEADSYFEQQAEESAGNRRKLEDEEQAAEAVYRGKLRALEENGRERSWL